MKAKSTELAIVLLLVLLLRPGFPQKSTDEEIEGNKVLFTDPAKETPRLPCHKNLINGYGYQAYEYPVDLGLEVCPQVKRSCCKYESQIEMLQDIKSDMVGAESYFLRILEVYKTFFKQLARAQTFANRMNKYLKHKPMSNCKVLANKLAYHRFRDIKDKLLEKFEDYHEYLKTSFKGVACTICDGEQQRFLRFDIKRLIVSAKFCRGVINHTIPFLAYVRVFFRKYVNMLTHFLSNCDFRGRYVEAEIPTQNILYRQSEDRQIETCIEDINGPKWLKGCARFCMNFSPIEMKNMFLPHLSAYMRLTNFIKARLKELRFAQQRDITWNLPDTIMLDKSIENLAESNDYGMATQFVLHDEDEDEEDKANDEDEGDDDSGPYSFNEIILFESEHMNKSMVGSDGSANPSLLKLKPVVLLDGTNFHHAGKATIQNDGLLQQIQDVVDASKAKEKEKQKSQTLGPQSTGK